MIGHIHAAEQIQVGKVRINFADRLFEWIATLTMALMALLLMLPGVTFTGAFAFAEDWGYGTFVVLAMWVTGTVRAAALVANGNIPVWGPKLRSLSAMVAGQLWLLFGGTLVYEAFTTGKISLGIACYGSLLVGELYAVGRASRDGAAC